MPHTDDRSGTARDPERPLFTPGVRRALSNLAETLDEPPQGSADDYAPPERRLALVSHRAADYSVDMDQIARDIEADPKQDLKERIRRLTYGTMMEVCEGILAATSGKPISTKEELAQVVDRWAAL